MYVLYLHFHVQPCHVCICINMYICMSHVPFELYLHLYAYFNMCLYKLKHANDMNYAVTTQGCSILNGCKLQVTRGPRGARAPVLWPGGGRRELHLPLRLHQIHLRNPIHRDSRCKQSYASATVSHNPSTLPGFNTCSVCLSTRMGVVARCGELSLPCAWSLKLARVTVFDGRVTTLGGHTGDCPRPTAKLPLAQTTQPC